MKSKNLDARAREILKKNIYLVMSTVGADGRPWVSPVYTAYDKNSNFYWTSAPKARHSRNIAFHNRISFVVFNSSAAEGIGEGVYFDALAYEMKDQKEMEKALKIFYERKHKKPKPAKEFLDNAPRRFYKAVPQKVWMNSVGKIDGYIIDRRTEVNL